MSKNITIVDEVQTARKRLALYRSNFIKNVLFLILFIFLVYIIEFIPPIEDLSNLNKFFIAIFIYLILSILIGFIISKRKTLYSKDSLINIIMDKTNFIYIDKIKDKDTLTILIDIKAAASITELVNIFITGYVNIIKQLYKDDTINSFSLKMEDFFIENRSKFVDLSLYIKVDKKEFLTNTQNISTYDNVKFISTIILEDAFSNSPRFFKKTKIFIHPAYINKVEKEQYNYENLKAVEIIKNSFKL